MKKIFLLSLGITALVSTGCNRNTTRSNLVKETYIHKYGVPLAKKDWQNQGKEGQIVKVLKDGITVTQNYEKGLLHGKTTYTFPFSSTVQKVENYDQGQLVAEILHYPSGVPMKEESYNNGNLMQITAWYEDGSPSYLETYQDNLLANGEYRTLLNVIESRVQDGQGIRMYRNNEGHLTMKDIIQNGELIERVTYFASGEPSSITSYENGLIHGQRMTFLQGGLPNTVEEWIHGYQDGITITYQNGEKISEIPYRLGKKHGVEKIYCDGSSIMEEVSWNNDAKHGPTVISIDGETKTEWYHQGELVSRITYERLNMR